ncbi:CHAT domain-containing protein [Planctomycetota bacterium]
MVEKPKSRRGTRAPGGVKFDPLSGTGPEIASISARFKDSVSEEHTDVLRGASATEHNVRCLSQGRRVAHLATHGFVRHDLRRALTTSVEERQSVRPGLERHLGGAGYDLMMLAGLTLAGANARRGGGDDDGILTAAEVQDLYLDGCELVVLSACDTARGRTETAGEGVIGLVRGFRAAGARSVVASLWPVDDEATRRLMVEFYARAFAKDGRQRPAVALREAALALRDTEVEVIDARASMTAGREVRVQRRPFAAPRHWAAFVAYGPLR